jgi:hypothetical protein
VRNVMNRSEEDEWIALSWPDEKHKARTVQFLGSSEEIVGGFGLGQLAK